MFYLNDDHLRELGIDWNAAIASVEEAARIVREGDYAQPIKPYLRYGDPANRIIAMPAYVGGEVRAAGIKWIASFPGNLKAGLPRAHSVVVLNDPDTGAPIAVLHSALPSIVRTAAVSGMMLRRVMAQRPKRPLRLCIIGWGPIGRHHLQMCMEELGDAIEEIRLFDLRGIDAATVPPPLRSRTVLCGSWEEAYYGADVVITCTVSSRRYINRKPKPGSLLLHVSLRDYEAQALEEVRRIVVDDWEEVCRENTDIELLAVERGLTKERTVPLAEAVCGEALAGLGERETVLFCPMGMAAFDIAVAAYYARRAEEEETGIRLP